MEAIGELLSLKVSVNGSKRVHLDSPSFSPHLALKRAYFSSQIGRKSHKSLASRQLGDMEKEA